MYDYKDYKIGDAVLFVRPIEEYEKPYRGKQGTIIDRGWSPWGCVIRFADGYEDAVIWIQIKPVKTPQKAEEETKAVKGFKIGDRVRATFSLIRGMTGTVIGFADSVIKDDTDPKLVTVEFDEQNAIFHDAGGKGKPGHCYKLYPDNIEPIIDESIKVGDRVTIAETSFYSWLHGKSGTVVCERPNESLFGIQFDETNSDFHSCDGCGKNGYCFWIRMKDVVKAKEEDAARKPAVEADESNRLSKDGIVCNKNVRKRFKVGDEVVVTKWYTDYDKTVLGHKGKITKIQDDVICFVNFSPIRNTTEEGSTMFFTQIQPVPKMERKDETARTVVIRITSEGATAKYIDEDGKKIKGTRIKRHPDDLPNDAKAAKYAVEALFGKSLTESEIDAEWASKTAEVLRGMDWNAILFKAYAWKK